MFKAGFEKVALSQEDRRGLRIQADKIMARNEAKKDDSKKHKAMVAGGLGAFVGGHYASRHIAKKIPKSKILQFLMKSKVKKAKRLGLAASMLAVAGAGTASYGAGRLAEKHRKGNK